LGLAAVFEFFGLVGSPSVIFPTVGFVPAHQTCAKSSVSVHLSAEVGSCI